MADRTAHPHDTQPFHFIFIIADPTEHSQTQDTRKLENHGFVELQASH